MKALIVAILIVASTIEGNSQKASQEWINELFPISQSNSDIPAELNCSGLTITGCGNRVSNNIFFPSENYSTSNPGHYQNPFNFQFQQISFIPNWEVSHGSPNISDGVNNQSPLPFSGAGYVRLAGWNSSVPDLGNVSEGVVQKIPALTSGNNYGLSFFKKLENLAPLSGTNMDRFTIILMHCADYPLIYRPNHSLSPIPTNSQTIYCERNVQNTNWQQVFIEFTANASYDMVWIFANQTELSSQPPTVVLSSYPELIGLTGFTGGPAPTPVQPNCTVTIGPAVPNCSVKNAVFTWASPNGPIITAPANQQIQVDASVAANVGIWTLSMAVPNAINPASNTCNPLAVVSATVNVPACVTHSWPKCYGVLDGFGPILKIGSGSILFSGNNIITNSTFYNHTGLFPDPNQPHLKTFQYSSSGATNWLSYSDWPTYVFNSGIVAMTNGVSGSSPYYVDGSTGVSVPSPFNFQAGEFVFAETAGGDALVRSSSGQLILYDLFGGVHPQSIYSNDLSGYFRYNKLNDELIIVQINFNGASYYRKYQKLGNSFQLIVSISMPSFSSFPKSIAIDGSGKYYFLDNSNSLHYYDPVSNLIRQATISGLPINSIEWIPNFSPYVNDMTTFYSAVGGEYIYIVDFVSWSQKKIAVSNLGWPLYSEFDNSNFFLAGQHFQNAQIGNQILPNINQAWMPTFITKLDINSDFQRTQNERNSISSNLQINISPNPVTSSLNLKITQNEKNSILPYSFTISNQMSEAILAKQNYFSGNNIDVSSLKTGVYFITVANQKGERNTINFIKL